MTAVATAHGAGKLGDLASLTDGYSAAFIGAAIVAVAGAAAAALSLRTPAAPSEADESVKEVPAHVSAVAA
jgi:hypothetical protein